jgi:ATP/maltotriose-dependent transcriptional regulator MalT
MNTIKTHNRRIYAKLGVSSRKEMMVYVEMMRDKT